MCAVAERPPSWLYFDLHAGLHTTTSAPDGALDWTGMAHALALADTVPALRQIGGMPLISPDRVLLFGHDPAEATDWEQEQSERLGLGSIPCSQVAVDPSGAAQSALRRLDAQAPVVVHFDVDIINFTDAPLFEHTGRGTGIPLAAALHALPLLMADQRVSALTVTELNPRHAAADPGSFSRFTAGLVSALAGRQRTATRPRPSPPAHRLRMLSQGLFSASLWRGAASLSYNDC